MYRGPQIGMIRSTISAPADPGAYRVTFSGSHRTSPVTAAGFVVSKVSVGQFDGPTRVMTLSKGLFFLRRLDGSNRRFGNQISMPALIR